MSYDVWKTLFTGDFDSTKYLYHYTGIEKAIKILYSNKLRFSEIQKTNDTAESKIRIVYKNNNGQIMDKNNGKVQIVSDYFKQYHDIVRLLCFSMDQTLSSKNYKEAVNCHPNHKLDQYYDVSGRGFALPRMWAQYATDNSGVCFIINKELFEEQLQKQVQIYTSRKVVYKSFFTHFTIGEDKLDSIYEKVKMVTNGSLPLISLIQNDEDFQKYNFFVKLKDWENEHEYRYIAVIEEKKPPLEIGNLQKYLAGVVIGEKIDPAFETVIKKLVFDNCSVKKISFNTTSCVVK